ncbi:MAG: SDR family oxidoreductase [Microthrixaceae bacterium]
MRLLVTGGTGFLGTAVIAAADAAGHDVIAARHNSPPPMEGPRPSGWVMLDVTDPHSVTSALEGADAVVHTAYRHSGDGVEKVNVTGAAVVAKATDIAGVRLVHVSSDVVFAGKPPRTEGYQEADRPDPVEGFDYGQQKASAERLVRAAHPGATIARTTLLYDGEGGSSLERMVISSAHPGSDTAHFTDEYRCPVHVDDVASALVQLAETEGESSPQVAHLGGPARMSRAEIARALAPHLGIDPEAMRTASSAESPGDRPADLTLDSSFARQLLGFTPRNL